MSVYPMVKVALTGAMAGYLLRSAAERRLAALRDRRRTRRPRTWVLRPDDPHRYAPERYWPGSCWCGKADGHPVHGNVAGQGAGR